MNLLIIDDERTVLKTVYSQLIRMGLEVDRIDAAVSAREARECMKKHRYDIFVCDIVMPEEDGIAFAKWALKECPQSKIIFLTAYADVGYMKEAISMQSFEYVLQPVSTEELRGVVERAVSQIKIEKRNLEMINRGAFFQTHEESILEAGTLRYLNGRDKDDSYICRLLTVCEGDREEEYLYLPVLIQVLRTQKKLDQIERPLLRMIYQNILDEVFQALEVSAIILLGERGGDFTTLFYWKQGEICEREVFADRLETFRILAFRVLQTAAAVYCGEICARKELFECTMPLLRTRKDNVRQVSRIFLTGSNEKDCGGQAYKLQIGSWKKLLDQNQFASFRDSILSYIQKDYHGHMNASGMINLHQSITQLILAYLVDHQIGSDRIFDDNLSYLTYMNAWQGIDQFEKALTYMMLKLQELVGRGGTRDVIQEIRKYIRQHLDCDLSVTEIAEYVGMNPEYLTKLFKKNTGYTLKEYIINEKMESAKLLLATTSLPVTLISSHVGYGNYSNFTRSFKQLVGCTPMEYRKGVPNQKMQ